MIISFDLDDTLFVNPELIDTENALNFPFNLIYKEKLRKGTIQLFNELKRRGHHVIIYTTSFRSISYIRNYFKKYGFKLKINEIINGERHLKEIQRDRREILPSKLPTRYGSTLHIDDDLSVKQNGQIYGFDVILIKEQDQNWGIKILKAVDNKMGLLESEKNRGS